MGKVLFSLRSRRMTCFFKQFPFLTIPSPLRALHLHSPSPSIPPTPMTPTCTVLLVAPVSAVVVTVALIHGEDALRRPQTLEFIRLAHVCIAHCNKQITLKRFLQIPTHSCGWNDNVFIWSYREFLTNKFWTPAEMTRIAFLLNISRFPEIFDNTGWFTRVVIATGFTHHSRLRPSRLDSRRPGRISMTTRCRFRLRTRTPPHCTSGQLQPQHGIYTFMACLKSIVFVNIFEFLFTAENKRSFLLRV